MRFGVSGNYQRTLARGAAVLLIGGLAAGCSSDVMRFEDSILTGSTPQGQQTAAVQQPYPGVDQTYTGSVASRNGGGILNRAGLVPRPNGDVSSGGAMVASAPMQNSYPQSQPVYSQPTYTPPANSSVTAGSALPPVAAATGREPLPAPSQVARVETTPQIPVAQPNAAPNLADARLPANNNAPVPNQAPAERVAVLPQQPKPKEQPAGGQLASTGTQNNGGAGSSTYTVVSGDTLNGIARRMGVSAEAIRQANGLSSGVIRIGQSLVIPAGGAAPAVQVASQTRTDPMPTATPAAAAAKPAGEAVAAYTPPVQRAEKVIQQASLDTTAPAPDATGISRMRWPVRGRVISGFGQGKNDGIDIAVPAGTPIKAAENGVVIYAGDGLKEFGNTVLVRHENGLVTVYGHASEINVQRGQKVRRGEDIAKAGMSGSADTPKLHFEVRKDSTPVDPSTYLE